MTKQKIPINVPFQTRRKPGRPKRIIENANTTPSLELPRKIGKDKIKDRITQKDIRDIIERNQKKNTEKVQEKNTEKSPEKAPEKNIEFSPVGKPEITLPFKARFKVRNTIPISDLLNPSPFSEEISSGDDMDVIDSTDKTFLSLETQKQRVKEQTDNLNFITIKMEEMIKVNCYLKRLEILDTLIPRAKNIAHTETRLSKTISILEMILKNIQFINGRDITDVSNDLKQKIERMKAEQFAIEDARQKAYQKSVEIILEKLNKNLEGI